MSLNYVSLLKISVVGVILLSVGACKPTDKGQGALKSQGVAALNLPRSEASIFGKYFEMDTCEVDELEALGALAGMGLGETGAQALTFESRVFNGGLVTYRDMAVTSEGEDLFNAKTAVFHCPTMGDEDPGYARLDLTDVVVRNQGIVFTFGTLNVANPSPYAAAAIIEGMIGPRGLAQGEVGFGAVSVTDVTIKSDDINGTLDTLSWGETRGEDGTGTADMTVENLDLVIPGQNGVQDMTVDFKGMSARNLSVGGKNTVNPALSPNGMLDSVVATLNAFEKPYDQLVIETMKLTSEGFDVDFGGIEGQTREDGDVLTTRQSLKPTIISFKPSLANAPAFAANYEILKTLGFETFKMSGSTVTALNSSDDTIAVSDGLLVIDDAFVLNFEYAAEGLSDVIAKLQQLQTDPDPAADPMAAYDALKLRNFRLTLEDNSIVERGLKLASQMTGESEKSLKLKLGLAVFGAAFLAENEVQADVYTKTVEAFSEFVNKGGTFTIEANPPAPFVIAPLVADQGNDVDPAALGFSASQEGGSE